MDLAVTARNHFTMVTHFYENKDLRSWCKKWKESHSDQYLPEKLILRLFSHICLGVEGSHGKGNPYGKVEAANVILTKGSANEMKALILPPGASFIHAAYQS